ncbi:ATP-grasp fold amidoligase family protein [Acidobacteriota bacterium]
MNKYRVFRSPLNWLVKRTYWPICRMYARLTMHGDKPADRVLNFLCALYFWKVHGYWPNFKHPRSFSEKVFHRMLFDRDPRWTMVSDKYRVRDYVESILGKEYLIPLLWKGDNPEEIPFSKLPSSFVIKTNHGCGYNIITKDKSLLNKQKTVQQLNKWLSENYSQKYYMGIEWAYKNIMPTVIVESFLEDNGNVPQDFKFFCYSGRAEFIQVSFDRFIDASERILDRNFKPLELYNGLKLYQGEIVPPSNYKEMIHVAESLSREFNFMRVDLYNVGERIYVGELTCYHAGGEAIFIPRKYDYVFGEKWKIN